MSVFAFLEDDCGCRGGKRPSIPLRIPTVGCRLLLAPLLATMAHVSGMTGGYWTDVAGDASPEAAYQAGDQGLYTPFGTMLVRGVVASTMWFQLDLPAATEASEVHVLRIPPPWHDEVVRVYPAIAGAVARMPGDPYPVANDEHRSLDLHFLVPPLTETRSVMVRINTHHSITFNAQLLSSDDAMAVDQRQFAGFMGSWRFSCSSS